jgi:hypothetical protein
MKRYTWIIGVAAIASLTANAYAQRACQNGSRAASASSGAFSASAPTATVANLAMGAALSRRGFQQELVRRQAVQQAYFARQAYQQQFRANQKTVAGEQDLARQRKIDARIQRRLAAEERRRAATERRIAARTERLREQSLRSELAVNNRDVSAR